MLYHTAKDWMQNQHKRVMLFGMSGLGKTHVSNILRAGGDWFHYSVDYRIGTRYMGEHIVDNFKAEAMRNPFLADLLRSDSIYIGSNITFENLSPLSSYMGKPGNPELGGIPFAEYQRRQEQHRSAEIAALLDTVTFIDRADRLYDYANFICDSGGSICEVVKPEDQDDPVLKALSDNLLMVWIKGGEDHAEELAHRFDLAPKPMYFGKDFLRSLWAEYTGENNLLEAEIDPDDFMRWANRKTLAHRLPIYRAMAENWGVSVAADDIARVKTTDDFDALIASALVAN
ncbi:MAG: ATPase [Alphaproteobacteria bacterium]|nr:ATPase [Alphaproteobacteria bacterium]